MRAVHGPALGLIALAALSLSGCGGGGGSETPGNRVPLAQAGSDQAVKRNATVTLDATGSTDPDGDTLAYLWTQTAGPTVALSSATSSQPSFTAPNQSGTVSFSLVASDGQSRSTADSVSIAVENTAPTAVSSSAISAGLGSMATLDATSSFDPDGDPLTFTWTQLSGPQVTVTVVAPGVSQFQVPNLPVVLVFALTVSDGEATSVTINITVNVIVVTVPNRAPVVSAGPDFDAPRRAPVTLNGTAFDPDFDPLTYTWEQVDGPAVTLANATTLSPTFDAPETPAHLTFALRASDGVLTSNTTEVEVNVRNFAPEVSNVAITPSAAYTADTLTLAAQVVDPDNDTVTTTYEWLRNGTPIGSQTSGTFPASLTTKQDVITARITADDGETHTTVEASTTILDSPATLTMPIPAPTELNYGDTANFTVAATDADGDPIPGFEVAYGPAGFEVTSQGDVTWTAFGPMFEPVVDFAWGVRVTGDASSLLAGSFEVTDAARADPVRRTGVQIPVQHSGLRIADLDGDGDREVLVGAPQALYVLSRTGSSYEQSWVYPFAVGLNDPSEMITAVAARDIDNDGAQEIFFSKGGQLLRLDGETRREAARASRRCRSLELADLDGNGSVELICLSSASDFIFDSAVRVAVLNPTTLAEVWSTPELSLGATMAIGNVDADAALEIVTSGGFVFDGQSHQNQWAYSQAFGLAVDTGDIDGDGVEEIVGIADWGSVIAFSAVHKSPLWEYAPQWTDLDALVVADANGDGRAEAIVGNGQWGNVMGIGYNASTHQGQLLWEINSQEHGVTSIAVGNIDANAGNEVVWGTGATSSGRDDFVVAGFTPVISVKWQASEEAQLDGPFLGGALARIGGGASRLMFDSPSTNSGYAGMRAIALHPTTGALELSDEVGSNWARAQALDVADYDNDGVDELFIGTANLYDGFFAVYDFAANSIEWQSAPQSETAIGVKHADVNADGYADLIGLTLTGYLSIYDVHAQSLLWRSTDLGNAVALDVSDLDGNGKDEIVVALTDRIVIYGKATIGPTYVERASVAVNGPGDVVARDLDGDGEAEIYVLRQDFGSNAMLDVMDTQLQTVRSIQLGVQATAVFVEESGFARKNLLLAVSSNYPYTTAWTEIWAIDPTTGSDVWRSPQLDGTIRGDSLHFVDVDGDGDREISFATSEGMYHTR